MIAECSGWGDDGTYPVYLSRYGTFATSIADDIYKLVQIAEELDLYPREFITPFWRYVYELLGLHEKPPLRIRERRVTKTPALIITRWQHRRCAARQINGKA